MGAHTYTGGPLAHPEGWLRAKLASLVWRYLESATAQLVGKRDKTVCGGLGRAPLMTLAAIGRKQSMSAPLVLVWRDMSLALRFVAHSNCPDTQHHWPDRSPIGPRLRDDHNAGQLGAQTSLGVCLAVRRPFGWAGSFLAIGRRMKEAISLTHTRPERGRRHPRSRHENLTTRTTI